MASRKTNSQICLLMYGSVSFGTFLFICPAIGLIQYISICELSHSPTAINKRKCFALYDC